MPPSRLISARFSHDAAQARQPRLPRAVAVQESQRPFVDSVRYKLSTGEYELRNFRCPCGSDPDDVVISETDRYRLPLTFVLCLRCGTIRIDPYLEQQSLEDFYVRVYQHMYRRTANLEEDFERQRAYGKRVLAWVRPWLEPGSWVYEHGCGAGGALQTFQDADYDVAGSDYSAELVEYGRRRGVKGLHAGPIGVLASQDLPKADLVYLHHVLEHVNDPGKVLIDCGAQLRPTGRIVVIVPDVTRIDDFSYPAGDLLPFLHVAHKFNFSVEGLQRTAGRAGYRTTRLVQVSNAPEIWMEIEPANGTFPYTVAGASATGEATLDRLTRIERLHRFGLCRAQLRRSHKLVQARVRGVVHIAVSLLRAAQRRTAATLTRRGKVEK